MTRDQLLSKLDSSRRLGHTFLLSSGEAAACLGVDVKTVRSWCSDGRLRYLRTLGGHRRIDSDQIAALISERV